MNSKKLIAIFLSGLCCASSTSCVFAAGVLANLQKFGSNQLQSLVSGYGMGKGKQDKNIDPTCKGDDGLAVQVVCPNKGCAWNKKVMYVNAQLYAMYARQHGGTECPSCGKKLEDKSFIPVGDSKSGIAYWMQEAKSSNALAFSLGRGAGRMRSYPGDTIKNAAKGTIVALVTERAVKATARGVVNTVRGSRTNKQKPKNPISTKKN